MHDFEDETIYGTFTDEGLLKDAKEEEETCPGDYETTTPSSKEPAQSQYRAEAIKAHLEAKDARGVVEIFPLWARTTTVTFLVVLLCAIILGFTTRVEIVSRGRGAIRPTAKVRYVIAQTAGIVESVRVRNGNSVHLGDTLASLASAPLEVMVYEATRQRENLIHRNEGQRNSVRQNYQAQTDQVKDREASARAQLQSLEASVQVQERKWQAGQHLLENGLISAIQLDDLRDSVSNAKRAVIAMQSGLTTIRQEMNLLNARMREDEIRWTDEERQADIRVGSAKLATRDANCFSPIDGVIDALLVKTGDQVKTGQAIARVVPVGSPMMVVAFLPEKDRAFVHGGDSVKLELDQYPYSEYGVAEGLVVGVSSDVVSMDDLREAVGEELDNAKISFVRVEIEVVRMPKGTATTTGMLLNARFTLRRVRPIVIFLDPLRKWFGS